MPCTLPEPHDCANVRAANSALRRHLDRACNQRDDATRRLDAALAREVKLREVLDAARRFMAAQLRWERHGEDAWDRLAQTRDVAMTRLRDVLRETRPSLLGGRPHSGEPILPEAPPARESATASPPSLPNNEENPR